MKFLVAKTLLGERCYWNGCMFTEQRRYALEFNDEEHALDRAAALRAFVVTAGPIEPAYRGGC